MSSFRIEDRFPCSTSFLWELAFDDAFQRRLDRANRYTRQLLDSDPKDFDPKHKLERRFRVHPSLRLPEVVAKALQSPLHYLESHEYLPSPEPVMKVRTRTSVLPEKIRLEGTLRMQACGTAQAIRIWEGSCACDIPWLGSRIEAAIVANIRDNFEKAKTLTFEAIDARKALERARP